MVNGLWFVHLRMGAHGLCMLVGATRMALVGVLLIAAWWNGVLFLIETFVGNVSGGGCFWFGYHYWRMLVGKMIWKTVMKIDQWVIPLILLVAIPIFFHIYGLWNSDKRETAQFLAYLSGGFLLILQLFISNRRATVAEKTAQSMEKGNVIERYKVAIEHLRSTSTSIRLGGIYALHNIAQEDESHSRQVFEILCAHVRETTRQKKI